jgi:catechol 2,3-dioxygenase-like lactoylglutathione lyase family enzyme
MITGLDHVAIQASDFDEALHFYHVLLGLPIVRQPERYKTRTLCYLKAGAASIELYSVKDDHRVTSYTTERGGLDHVSFLAPDLDAAISFLVANGVRLIKAPFEIRGDDGSIARLAFVAGPDDQEIELREAPAVRLD